jgi:Methylmalonyl-CoA mutase, N-terminal domain/subunit
MASRTRNVLTSDSLKVTKLAARDLRNVLEQLIDVAKYNSPEQISHALYDVGGEYRRNM